MGNFFSGGGGGSAGRYEEEAVPDGRTGTVNEVLMFPDKAMPCKYGRTCRRGASCTYSHENTSLKRLIERLSSARQSVDVCVFTITCNEIAQALLDLHQRNVRVRIISDDEQSKSLGSDVQRMASAGIPVRMDNSPTHMHHKFAIIDNRFLVNGSFNWTRSAVLGNRENVMILDQYELRQPFLNEFERLWKEYAGNQLRAT